MRYQVLFKYPAYYVFKDTSDDKLYCTVILGDVAIAIDSFEMSREEIQDFEAEGQPFLEALRSDIEMNRVKYTTRFIKDFYKHPEIEEAIRITSFTPHKDPKKGFFERLFKR